MRLIAALLLILALPVRAADAPEGVSAFTLDNGMEVVVIEDTRAPVVVHMVWYRVGAIDEPPGKSGIAHFLEHLMFKGTESYGPGEFQRLIEANGGQDNAFTSWDYTGYFQRVASDRLPLVMELEADRMRGLILTDDLVAPERGVVLEERNTRVETDPGAIFAEQRRRMLYLNHPYGLPIIGWQHEIEGLTTADALDFYDRHYAPDNAILIVAGDVTAAEVRALADTHYGSIAARDIPPRAVPAEPPHLVPRRFEYQDPRVSQPYLLRTYLGPHRRAGAQEDAAATRIMAELLGGGVTSHLVQRLQFEQKIALDAGAFFNATGLGPQPFGVYVIPAEGVSLEEAEAAMDAAIAEFIADGPDPADLARIKVQVRAGQIYALDSLQGRARRYGAGLTSGLTLDDIHAWPETLASVTAEDVVAAAERLFDLRRSVTGYLTGPGEDDV